jgi:predicted RecB family nuclease
MLLLSPVKVAQLNHGMIYPYRINQQNLDAFSSDGTYPLKLYLEDVFKNCPDSLFLDGPRASKLNFPLNIQMREEPNHQLCTMTAKALEKKGFQAAHDAVEDYFLENDTNTVAAEIPLWTNFFEMSALGNGLSGVAKQIGDTRPLTGHIDLLQVKDGKVVILDFKPKAHKEKRAHVQLFAYALMMSIRTGISMDNMECVYFDEKTSYWFEPGKARLAS